MRTIEKGGRRAAMVAPLMLACAAAVSYGATLYSFDISSGSTINATDGTRTNVDWINTGGGVSGGGFIFGDAFTLPAGNSYLVTSISVYAVANKVSDNTASLFASEFSSISLYEGPYAVYPTTPCSTATDAGTCDFTAVNIGSPTITPVTYSSSANGNACTGYLAEDGVSCLPFYKITFSVDLLLTGGTAYEFAADGTLAEGLSGCLGDECGWYNLASTGGPNGNIYAWDGTDLTGGSQLDPTTSPCCTDMNVIIDGSLLTPEPATLTLSGLGIAALAFAAIRRSKANPKLPC